MFAYRLFLLLQSALAAKSHCALKQQKKDIIRYLLTIIELYWYLLSRGLLGVADWIVSWALGCLDHRVSQVYPEVWERPSSRGVPFENSRDVV